MMPDISLPVAFGAGFVSFASPCVLPLVPAYITYITGTTLEEELENKKLFAVVRTFGFVIGFTLIFIIMGASASFLGKLFDTYQNIFSKVSGILIVGFGLSMMGILKLNILNKHMRFKMPRITGWFSSVLMGMAFAAGWTPCMTAVLGPIILYASRAATVSKGIQLLFFYSMGLGIAFILTALLINRFSKFLIRLDKFIPYIMKISGAVIILLGILIFFDKLYIISNLFI